MLQRQVEYYRIAVKIAQVVIKDGGGEVIDEVVEVYAKMPRNKVYAGRPAVSVSLRPLLSCKPESAADRQYSIERVEQIVRSSRAYAEYHLDFLREDPDCVCPRSPPF